MRFGRERSSTFWVWGLVIPGILIILLLILFSSGLLVQRPYHISITNDPSQRPSAPPPPTQPPQGLLVGIGLGVVALVITVIVVAAAASKTKSPGPSVQRRTKPPTRMGIPVSLPPPPTIPRPAPISAIPAETIPVEQPMKAVPVEETVPCPHCGERIQKRASACRFCGFELDRFVER